jgi:hypothetical protein
LDRSDSVRLFHSLNFEWEEYTSNHTTWNLKNWLL